MDEAVVANAHVAESSAGSRRSRRTKLVPLAVIAIILVGAFAIMSKPTFGSRTMGDSWVKVVVGESSDAQETRLPITLQEGGDPAHEVDHVIEPLKEAEGLSTATLDWSSGVFLTVTFDPEVITSQEIANLLRQSGYLAAPVQ